MEFNEGPLADSRVMNAQSAQDHFVNNQVMQTVFANLEQLCGNRVPDEWLGFCATFLANFRYVAEGLRHGDRSDQVCIRHGFCPDGSYIFKSAHSPVALAGAAAKK